MYVVCMYVCMYVCTYVRTYIHTCSKKDRTLAIKTYYPFYSILSTVPFKVVPSTGDIPFPTFLPLLKCFLKRTFRDGAQFSYRIFLIILYGLETASFQSGFKFAGAKAGE